MDSEFIVVGIQGDIILKSFDINYVFQFEFDEGGTLLDEDLFIACIGYLFSGIIPDSFIDCLAEASVAYRFEQVIDGAHFERFDCVLIDGNELEWISNAFAADD